MQKALLICVLGRVSQSQSLQEGLLDDPGLLQVRKQLSLKPPMADAVSLHSLDSLNELVTQMSVGDPSQSDLDLISRLIDTLKDNFEPELNTSSAADKQAYSDKITAHNLCKTHRDRRLSTDENDLGDVTKLEHAFTEKRTKHRGCRKAFKSYELFDKDADAVSDASWDTLAGVSGHTPNPALGTLCSSKDTFTSDLSDYTGLPPTGVSSDCDIDQTSFEEEYCSWLSAKTSACLACDECIEQVDAAGFKDNIVMRDEHRRATYQTIQKLKCRLQHLMSVFNLTDGVDHSDHADQDTCGDVGLPNNSHYEFGNLPTPTPISSCVGDADIHNPKMPSTTVTETMCSDWITQEYSSSSSPAWTSAYSAVTACHATCVVPTSVDQVSPTPRCTDDGTDCAFYSFHADSCGSYADNADTRCCACGGGSWSRAPGDLAHYQFFEDFCVGGHNLKSYPDPMTAEECAELCDTYDDCLGFEFGGDNPEINPDNFPGRCRLQDCANYENCAGVHNLHFYSKCDSCFPNCPFGLCSSTTGTRCNS